MAALADEPVHVVATYPSGVPDGISAPRDATVQKFVHLGAATNVLVESLLRRRRAADLDEAQTAINTLAAVQTNPGWVLYELPLMRMRALVARARDDDRGYRLYADRYLAKAQALEFEGHLATARAVT
jgi:hypothetical protein